MAHLPHLELIPVVPFFREAYLNGQPALPKYLDSWRHKRVSIFHRCHGLEMGVKSLRVEQWSQQRSMKKLPRPRILPLLLLQAAIRCEGRAFYVADTWS